MAQGHAGHIVNEIVKEPPDFFQRVAQGFFDGFFHNVSPMSPQDTLWSHQWLHFESDHNVSPGGIVNELRGTLESNHHVPPGESVDKLFKKPQYNQHVSPS